MAVNCSDVPAGIDGDEGEIAIDRRAGGKTANVAEPVIVPRLAWTITTPVLVVIASPGVPAPLLTVTIPVLEDPQLTIPVKS